MTDIKTLIIETANRRDMTFAQNFNGRAYALMDANWIGYFDELDDVIEFLGISVETDTDIELVIKIPEEIYNHTQEYEVGGFSQENDTKLFIAIKNGTPLPKGHGDIIDVSELEEIYLNDESLEDIQDAIFAIKRVTPIIKADKAESEDKE